jgi:hypothetical protein
MACACIDAFSILRALPFRTLFSLVIDDVECKDKPEPIGSWARNPALG